MGKCSKSIKYIFLVLLVGCSVKQELNGLQELKQECGDLELELASLKASKWTEVIDKKVSQCNEHGFWSGKLERQRDERETKKVLEDF